MKSSSTSPSQFIDDNCQHGIECGKDCSDCDKLPHCKRIYGGEKNRCYFNLGFTKVKRCVYCGELPQ